MLLCFGCGAVAALVVRTWRGMWGGDNLLLPAACLPVAQYGSIEVNLQQQLKKENNCRAEREIQNGKRYAKCIEFMSIYIAFGHIKGACCWKLFSSCPPPSSILQPDSSSSSIRRRRRRNCCSCILWLSQSTTVHICINIGCRNFIGTAATGQRIDSWKGGEGLGIDLQYLHWLSFYVRTLFPVHVASQEWRIRVLFGFLRRLSPLTIATR